MPNFINVPSDSSNALQNWPSLSVRANPVYITHQKPDYFSARWKRWIFNNHGSDMVTLLFRWPLRANFPRRLFLLNKLLRKSHNLQFDGRTDFLFTRSEMERAAGGDRALIGKELRITGKVMDWFYNTTAVGNVLNSSLWQPCNRCYNKCLVPRTEPKVPSTPTDFRSTFVPSFGDHDLVTGAVRLRSNPLIRLLYWTLK